MERNFVIQYKGDFGIVTTNQLETDFYTVEVSDKDNRFQVVLKPKKVFELVAFYVESEYEFMPGDNFYAGGYQSWSTSREYRNYDIQKSSLKLAQIHPLTEHITKMYGDEYMVEYSELPGEFHSHCYTYIRNGENCKFWGSLSEKTGFTYFKVKMNDDYFAICKDVEGKVVTEDYTVFDIVYFEGTYDEVFDAYFDMQEMPATRKGQMSGYTSWYNYFQNINEDIILRDLNGLDEASEEVSIFQIDDGYEPFVGDWLDPCPEKFPHGMGYIADKIHEKGYKAGIWVAPFSCQIKSRMAKEHPDWLIKNENGKPMLGVPAWGGAYIFDIFNEEVREYIRHFFDVILNEWNYDMVKLDFLYSQCIKPRNGKCRGEIMYAGMCFLRDCVGDKLFLGCGAPIGTALGIVDACRISCDVAPTYEGKFYNKYVFVNNEIISAQNAINNSIFRRHLNGRAWMNDPDVFFLRDDNIKFTKEQKLLLATINNLCGNVLFVSDNAGDYDATQMKWLKKFFKKTDEKIIGAEYITDDIIRIRVKDGKMIKTLTFNIKTGKVIKNLV
ncbi:MAG: alpha-galactosidase [Ruminococcaceae bacterium]|nr:alpha-galactosidase [Oscillospiraceae bacterium]